MVVCTSFVEIGNVCAIAAFFAPYPLYLDGCIVCGNRSLIRSFSLTVNASLFARPKSTH